MNIKGQNKAGHHVRAEAKTLVSNASLSGLAWGDWEQRLAAKARQSVSIFMSEAGVGATVLSRAAQASIAEVDPSRISTPAVSMHR